MNTSTEKLTTETLQMRLDSFGAILAHGDHVLASFATWTKADGYGNSAQVYKLTEQPINGLGVMSRDVVLAPARNDTVPIQEVSVQTACHWAVSRSVVYL